MLITTLLSIMDRFDQGAADRRCHRVSSSLLNMCVQPVLRYFDPFYKFNTRQHPASAAIVDAARGMNGKIAAEDLGKLETLPDCIDRLEHDRMHESEYSSRLCRIRHAASVHDACAFLRTADGADLNRTGLDACGD
jgi:hypothetical protein